MGSGNNGGVGMAIFKKFRLSAFTICKNVAGLTKYRPK